ncbi:MAG: hypothetical protein IKT41_02660, partial [Clostridia bacterium]|nr:hypothetical protein [Clostridia bacterium]
KADWQTKEEIVGIVKAEEKGFEAQEDRVIDGYTKYLTNKAMIIETSEKDRDESDWKDSETIYISKEPTPTPTVTPTPTPTAEPTATPTVTPTPTPTPTPTLLVGIPITMEIAGNIFEDLPSTKAGEGDNKLGAEDGMLAGIEVTLYECTEDGEIIGLAKLYQQHEENPNISKADSEIRTNPTITDEYGNYSFKGLDPTKKYNVKFKYNGLVYEPVKCDDQVEYNGEKWSVTSKAVENSDNRTKLNTKFSEISASPNNYANGKVFLQKDLENDRIYDGQNIYELITSKIREDIANNRAYPNIEDIYADIISNYSGIDSEIAEKIQFIEDCKIEAETNRVYPVYDEFVIDSSAVQLKIGEKDTITPQTKYVGPKEGVNNYTDEYKQICNILKDVVDEVKASDEKFNIEYNLESDFVIDEETVQEDGIVGSFNVPIYIQELVKNDSTNEYEIQLKEDGVNAGVDAIKDKLAVSLTEKIETDFNYVAPEGEEDSEPISIQKQLIYDKFENHKDRIQDIVDDIIDKATLYYNNNFEVLTIGSINEDVPNIYPGQKQIHLGLVKREEFDLTIAKDVYQIDLSINGQNITYNYNNVDIDAYTGDWVAEVRAVDTFYERNIYASDYYYHEINDTGKLTMSVTYRIALRNQTAGIIGAVTEIVDYYDEDYIVDKESIYISDGKNSENGRIYCNWNEASIYNNYEEKSHDYLNVGFITFDGEGLQIESGTDKFIYITFKVNDTNGIIADGTINKDGLKELENSKQNIVEINGYKTYYTGNTNAYNGQNKSNMTPAGVLDYDSIPGNYIPKNNYKENDEGKQKQYYADEDDVGVANGLYILIDYYNQRTIEGTVWEDEVLETLLSQNIRQGDGEFTDNEKPIQNVKATLMNYNENNDKYEDGDIVQYYDIDLDAWVDLAVHTNKDGKYSLKGFVPGVYDVWFTYDNYSINRELNGEAYNETRYNGQDYKSTIYKEKDVEGKWYLDESNRMSDAKDVWTRREEVNAYSKTLTNDIAESLIPSDLNKYNVEKTTMYARTDKLQIDVEYDKTKVQNTSWAYKKEESEEKFYETKNDYNKYVIDNVDFGLVERPRAQLSIQNNVSNVKVILADGTVLFDAIPTESGKFEYTNLGSIPRKLATAYVETKEEGVPPITKLKNSTHVSTEQGRITMNMDEELMQGANLQVTYEISVKNIGELDYNNKNFYDYGATLTDNGGNIVITIPDDSNLVTTKVEQIIDYVENNMKFSNTLNNQDINKGWEVKAQADVGTAGTDVVLKDTVIKALFNDDTTETDDAFNTIVALDSSISDTYDASGKFVSTTNNATKPLVPGDTTSSDFILTQLISPENENDDLTYKNVLEIVKSSNSVGRRMYFSIAGNHVPVDRDESNPVKILGTSLRPEGREIDTDDGELITIIPPFGANMIKNTNYAILAIALVAFFGVGVYLIKKKVLK